MKLIIAERTRSGKTTLAQFLADKMNLTVLKTCTNRPKRHPKEDTYHFYTREESDKIPMSEKKLLTTALDNYERWTNLEDLAKADIAILDEQGIPEATRIWHSMGHRVILIYANAFRQQRLNAALDSARKRGLSTANIRAEFQNRDKTESEAFERMEQTIAEQDTNEMTDQTISHPDRYIVWYNHYTDKSLDMALHQLEELKTQRPDLFRTMGYLHFTEKEPYILEKEDWTESEWATLCKLHHMLPQLTSRMITNPSMTHVFLEEPGSNSIKQVTFEPDYTDVAEPADRILDLVTQSLKFHDIITEASITEHIYGELQHGIMDILLKLPKTNTTGEEE